MMGGTPRLLLLRIFLMISSDILYFLIYFLNGIVFHSLVYNCGKVVVENVDVV